MANPPPEQLKRILSLPLVILYGLGITIGAGIYVLVGETAGRAGMLAPFAFIGAAIVMLFPALCFAELSGRYPFSSGAAQYVPIASALQIARYFLVRDDKLANRIIFKSKPEFGKYWTVPHIMTDLVTDPWERVGTTLNLYKP